MTFWSSHENFGQLLQAYALQEYLCREGHEAFLLKYDRALDNAAIRIQRASLFRRLAHGLKARLRRKTPTPFDEFRRRYMRFSSTEYRSAAELQRNPPHADVWICGSDQIWNHDFVESPEPFFLSFAGPSSLRLSYAASFGRPELPGAIARRYRELIQSLDLVSVREESGLEICRKLGRPDAMLMPDPTFLFPAAEWRRLAAPVAEPAKPSHRMKIFSYILEGRPLRSKNALMRYLESRPDTELLHCTVHTKSGKTPLSIPQWLAAINGCDAVVTNSFHAVVFSILFNKKFIALLVEGRDAGMNERITGLLARLGLSGWILRNADAGEIEELLRLEPPWALIHDTLALWRKQGADFLNFNACRYRLGC